MGGKRCPETAWQIWADRSPFCASPSLLNLLQPIPTSGPTITSNTYWDWNAGPRPSCLIPARRGWGPRHLESLKEFFRLAKDSGASLHGGGSIEKDDLHRLGKFS